VGGGETWPSHCGKMHQASGGVLSPPPLLEVYSFRHYQVVVDTGSVLVCPGFDAYRNLGVLGIDGCAFPFRVLTPF